MTSVSRETERLVLYRALLEKWQQKINLIGSRSIGMADDRHFKDCEALLPHIHGRTLLDLGSGAGFPGMVIAIHRPDLDITLVDSDQRKCAFLKVVSRETDTPVKVLNHRIELLTPWRVDTVTARALAPLSVLLDLVLPFYQVNPAMTLVLFKGENWADEVVAAKKKYAFDNDIVHRAASGGVLLRIGGINTTTG